MSRRVPSEPAKEDLLTVALIIGGCMLMMALLIWVASSKKIVVFWTPKIYAISKVWGLIPGPMGSGNVAAARETAEQFWASPKDVHLGDWLLFVNMSILPVTVLLTLALSAWVVWVCMQSRPDVRRRFKPHDLATKLSFVFTGTAPVLHLRKAIAHDKEPKWRRQTFPHEVLLNEMIDGKPMVKDDQMVRSQAEAYFRGIVMQKRRDADGRSVMVPQTNDGRLVSRMLGNQVVDLLTDRGKAVVFPDRFSSAGKVIYALLCAHAFGGEEGIEDYRKAADQLNNSARNAKHGYANLTVAQWLFDKYREHPVARQLFAIHHWEYTYLFELSLQAKRQGKCVHTNYMWLKPMSRFMFYVMNTVGRMRPHTEAAAAFTQYGYERRVARRHRLPLMRDDKGAYFHVIYMDKAVDGLEKEWVAWRDGTDDEDDWWKSADQWKRLNGIRLDPPTAPPAELDGDTAFDRRMRGDEANAASARSNELAAAVNAERARLEETAEDMDPAF